MTLFAFAGSLSCNIRPKTEGMTCHDKPYLSYSQPHLPFSSLSESFSHMSSTSCCDAQLTKNDTASVKVNCGPPFSTKNSCPSSWNRFAPRIFEFLKIET